MTEEKEHPTTSDEAVDRAAHGSETVEQTHKYLEVEITRTQGTLVFLKVPKGFNHRACSNLQEILKAAAVETCDESDWRLGSDQWEDTVEWQAIKEVPQKEAEAYKMYEVESPNGALCDGDEPPQTLKSKQS